MSSKSCILVSFSFLLSGLSACHYYKKIIIGTGDLIEDLDTEIYKLRGKYKPFKYIVPKSWSIITSYNQEIIPPLDSNKSVSYWSSRFYNFHSFDRFEFSKNDTVQEGFYFVKEKQQMYYYIADWHYKPNRLIIKLLPYDTAHYALKVIHQNRMDLLDSNTKYLISTVQRTKKSQWKIKAWGYYQGKRYD